MKLNEYNLKNNSGVKERTKKLDIPTRQLVRTHWGLMAWKNLKKVKIFGSGTNRSARAIWTANELGLEYELVTSDVLAENPQLRSLHPQQKIPSALIGDVEIFESSAICEYLCDSLPGNNLLAPSGRNVLYILSGSL